MTEQLSKTHRYFFAVKAAREILAGSETLERAPGDMVRGDKTLPLLLAFQYLQDVLEDVFRSQNTFDSEFKPFGTQDVFETSKYPLSIMNPQEIIEAAERIVLAHANAENTYTLTSQLRNKVLKMNSVVRSNDKTLGVITVADLRHTLTRDLYYLDACKTLIPKSTNASGRPHIEKRIEKTKKALEMVSESLEWEIYTLIAYERLRANVSNDDYSEMDGIYKFVELMEDTMPKLQREIESALKDLESIEWKNDDSYGELERWTGDAVVIAENLGEEILISSCEDHLKRMASDVILEMIRTAESSNGNPKDIKYIYRASGAFDLAFQWSSYHSSLLREKSKRFKEIVDPRVRTNTEKPIPTTPANEGTFTRSKISIKNLAMRIKKVTKDKNFTLLKVYGGGEESSLYYLKQAIGNFYNSDMITDTSQSEAKKREADDNLLEDVERSVIAGLKNAVAEAGTKDNTVEALTAIVDLLKEVRGDPESLQVTISKESKIYTGRLFGDRVFAQVTITNKKRENINIYDALLAVIQLEPRSLYTMEPSADILYDVSKKDELSVLRSEEIAFITAQILLHATEHDVMEPEFFPYDNMRLFYAKLYRKIEKAKASRDLKTPKVEDADAQSNMSNRSKRHDAYLTSEGEDYDAYAWGDEEDIGLGDVLTNGNVSSSTSKHKK